MKKRTNRRVWNLIDPISHAAYQAAKLTQSEWNAQILPVQIAIDALSRGEWGHETWGPVLECLNRIESMLALAKAPDHGFVSQAQTAMVAALDRQASSGVTALRASELATLREVLTTYGDLLKEISHGQFARACAHTNANMARLLREKQAMRRAGNVVFEMAQ